jgi:hypothetical protein
VTARIEMAMGGEIATATRADLESLLPALRQADIDEIRAASGLTPEAALKRSFALSTHVWVAREDRAAVIALWGVGPLSLSAGKGCPWLLASAHFDHCTRQIVKLSRPMLARMRAAYPYLENHVDARNRRAVRWLDWLGFSIEPPAPWGVERRLFHRFWM